MLLHGALILLLRLVLTLSFPQYKSEDPGFRIHEKTPKIVGIHIRKEDRGTENIIQITAQNASGGVGRVSSSTILPPADISFIILQGNYNIARDLNQNARGRSLQLMDVVFPCRLQLTVSGQVCDFEITQKGFWKVELTVLK